MSILASYTSLPPISIQEFKLFHNIDRKIFAHLVFDLCRDTLEYVQIVAFWLWLERSRYSRSLIHKLLSWPLAKLNQIVSESAMCLQCVQTDLFTIMDGYERISLLQSMTDFKITFRELHENRTTVVNAVSKIINEICLRAFDDIIMRIVGSNAGHVNPNTTPNLNPIPNPNPNPTPKPSTSFHHQVAGVVPFFPSVGFAPFVHGASGNVMPISNLGPNPNVGFVPYAPNLQAHFERQVLNLESMYRFDRQGPNLEPQLTHFERRVLNLGSNDLHNHSSLIVNEEVNNDPQVERTIFLTFSKGYPLSEMEVRDFFTRRFGDFIEALYMQEVGPNEQVLYTRLVARSASIINRIVEGNGKSKFSINGKHVWARKFVKKNNSRSTNHESNLLVVQSSPVRMAPQEPDYARWGGYHMWLMMHDSDEDI